MTNHKAPLSDNDRYGNRRYAISVPTELLDEMSSMDRTTLIERKGISYDLQPSVTSIENAVYRPALENWKSGRLVRWMIDNIGEVAEAAVVFDSELVAPTVLKRVEQHTPEADFGTRVHGHLENFARTGEIPEVPDDERPYVEAGVEYWTSHVDSLLAVEAVVWHPGMYGYAGRMDALTVQKGKVILTDYKTSSNHEAPWRAWPNHSRQQLCYARAPWIHLGGRWQRMPKVHGAHLVYLTSDGKYAARDADFSDRTWDDFLTIRKAYDLAFPKWRA